MLKEPLVIRFGSAGLMIEVDEPSIHQLIQIERAMARNNTAPLIGSQMALDILSVVVPDHIDVATIKCTAIELRKATEAVLEFTGFKEPAAGKKEGAAPAGE